MWHIELAFPDQFVSKAESEKLFHLNFAVEPIPRIPITCISSKKTWDQQTSMRHCIKNEVFR